MSKEKRQPKESNDKELSHYEIKRFGELMLNRISNSFDSLNIDLDIIWGLQSDLELFNKILHIYFSKVQKNQQEQYKKAE